MSNLYFMLLLAIKLYQKKKIGNFVLRKYIFIDEYIFIQMFYQFFESMNVIISHYIQALIASK
jgi:hypothetical protein